MSSKIVLDKTSDEEGSRNKYWKSLSLNKLNQSVKIFTTFCLFFTKMVVAHNNIVSTYDIILNKWEQHIVLEAPVKSIYRMIMDSKKGIYKLGILLRNDTIHTLSGIKDHTKDFEI